MLVSFQPFIKSDRTKVCEQARSRRATDAIFDLYCLLCIVCCALYCFLGPVLFLLVEIFWMDLSASDLYSSSLFCLLCIVCVALYCFLGPVLFKGPALLLLVEIFWSEPSALTFYSSKICSGESRSDSLVLGHITADTLQTRRTCESSACGFELFCPKFIVAPAKSIKLAFTIPRSECLAI